MHLAVHLENGQRVYFTTSNVVQQQHWLVSAICQSNPFARTFLYTDMLIYNIKFRMLRRIEEFSTTVARWCGSWLPGYAFYWCSWSYAYSSSKEWRMIIVVYGPTSFETLWTVNGIIFPTNRATCEKLNLLENDTHWHTTIVEANSSASACSVKLFLGIVYILFYWRRK